MPHYYVIIDYECTCWENKGPDDALLHPHEIIEFPAVFLNSDTLEIDFEFHAYVRPTENPVLSPFCFELTGIEQAWVDSADDLKTVMTRFEDFLIKNDINRFTTCTDGPWDFVKFLRTESIRKGIAYPTWALKWVDIRRRFEEDHKLEKRVGVNEMLAILGLEFEGRPHSGIDDARNIARIVKSCHKNLGGVGKLRVNRFISAPKCKVVK